MKRMLVAFLALTLAVAGCETSAVVPSVPLKDRVVDHGNGIYYFPLRGGEFPVGLSQWREAHPELRIVAVAIDPNDGHFNYAKGYIVVTEPK